MMLRLWLRRNEDSIIQAFFITIIVAAVVLAAVALLNPMPWSPMSHPEDYTGPIDQHGHHLKLKPVVPAPAPENGSVNA